MSLDYVALRAELTRDEGLRLKPYLCTAGKRTIGIGRNLDDKGLNADEARQLGSRVKPTTINGRPAWTLKLGVKITAPEAQMLLDNDIHDCMAELDRRIPWWRTLSGPRQRVMINMIFNMGWGNGRKGLSTFTNTLELIRTGQYQRAAINMRASAWRKQVGMRAERLAQTMWDGR